ncbi:hypothetical protein MYRA21_0100 [Myroides sp. A21]|uniref:hypothetical protein n=1 Tax=Myroides sp. A21 TaxID=1583100 RepID=UPI00057F34A5|nr:hypothetical protein [Myroides sp. A21]AJA67344.1 hypothetical protein MYRA21_0100 [Myroides sp. A21]
MQDSLNALVSYLNTLNDKGFYYSLMIFNGNNLRVALIPNHKDTMGIDKFSIKKNFNEYGISEVLEQVENYVESKINKNEPIKN